MMPDDELAFFSIEQVAGFLRQKKLSPVELVETLLARIERLDGRAPGRLNAYITVLEESARRAARQAEREIFHGRYRGPLHGIPLALKDNIWTRGVRTTAGSKILTDFVPAEDSTVARRLARAGAVLIGKTNLHEFAYGVTTENPHFGPTRNPWDRRLIPGGSSGGSAAAVAAGLAYASVGTDTGGSIRIPAALCGIVGLKPTFGRVSCHGVVELARSLDHVGPLARTVADAAILLGAIAGHDPRDPLSAAQPVPDYFRLLRNSLGRVRLGWPREYFFERLDGDVRRAVEAAARQFKKLGARIEPVSLPHVTAAMELRTQIALAEATRFHESAGYFPARAGEYGEDVRKRLKQGAAVRAVDYLLAIEEQKKELRDFQAALERVDAILAPTVPLPAPRLGTKYVTVVGRRESVRSALVRLNRPANSAGLPAISIPCGFTPEGLPIGLQLIGGPWKEASLLRIAAAFERLTAWHTRHPQDP